MQGTQSIAAVWLIKFAAGEFSRYDCYSEYYQPSWFFPKHDVSEMGSVSACKGGERKGIHSVGPLSKN
jgi:hypothetical protein